MGQITSVVNETYNTETRPRHWSDVIETRLRRQCRQSETIPRRDVQKTSRGVRLRRSSRDYTPSSYCTRSQAVARIADLTASLHLGVT